MFAPPDPVLNEVLGDAPSHQIPLARLLELLPADIRIAPTLGTAKTLLLSETDS